MAKSIRSKIKRKWRAEKRKQIGKPVEDKRLNDALSRLQGKLVKGSRLEAAKQALAGKGEAVEVVDEDANADKRFSFADRSWKVKTPAFNKSLHDMIQEEISAGDAAKKEAEESEGAGVEEEDEEGTASGSAGAADDEKLTRRDKESIATAAAAAGEFGSSLAYLGREDLKSSTDHASRALKRLRRRKKPRHEVFF